MKFRDAQTGVHVVGEVVGVHGDGRLTIQFTDPFRNSRFAEMTPEQVTVVLD